MALKSAWAYRNGKHIVNESKKSIAEIERKQKADFHAKLPEIQKQRAISESKFKKAFQIVWDGLKVGDSLKCFGLNNIVIKKKNKKSIISVCFDEKYTITEIYNLMR